MSNEIIAAKIRKYIKRLRSQIQKYTVNEAFHLIRTQIKMDEGLKENEMGPIDKDIRERLKENWPFKDVI
jgi:transcription initiation factor IIE alpha subunit